MDHATNAIEAARDLIEIKPRENFTGNVLYKFCKVLIINTKKSMRVNMCNLFA